LGDFGGILPLNDGTLFAERDRNFHPFVHDTAPNVRLFLEYQLLFDDQHFLHHWNDEGIVLCANGRCLLDRFIHRHAIDFDLLPFQVRAGGFEIHVNRRVNADPAGRNDALIDARFLLGDLEAFCFSFVTPIASSPLW